jgi:hypothetical protein
MMILTSRHGVRSSETLHVICVLALVVWNGIQMSQKSLPMGLNMKLSYYIILFLLFFIFTCKCHFNVWIIYRKCSHWLLSELIHWWKCFTHSRANCSAKLCVKSFCEGSSVADFKLCNILGFPAYVCPWQHPINKNPWVLGVVTLVACQSTSVCLLLSPNMFSRNSYILAV